MSTASKRLEEVPSPTAASPRPIGPRFILYFGCPAPERADVEKRLATARIHVMWVESGSQSLAELSRRNMPLVIDLARGGAALQFIREIRTERPATTLFAIVDSNRPELSTEAVLAGVADLLPRSPSAQRVARALEREIWYQTAAGQRFESLATGDDLYCQSSAMRHLLPLVTRAATTGSGALVIGEEGSGRQTVAEAIHTGDPTTAEGKFVVVDCAGVASGQLSAELFGAQVADGVASRGPESISETSRIWEARGGTLYLKNIADAPTRVQARLARLFRDHEAILHETGATVNFVVRPIIGADAGIDTAVEEGRVRDDLFRRVSAIRLDVPALRSRREDVAALANFFLRRHCAACGVPTKMLSRSVLTLIDALPWRGNADELEKVIEAVVSTSNSNRMALEDVLRHVRLDGGAMVFTGSGTLRQARARFERDYIAAMLGHHRGRITEAAKALGIQRPNLYRKIRALNVTRFGRRSGAA